MNEQDEQRFQTWFDSFCGAFRTANQDDQRNFDLKQEHTRRVLVNANEIAEGLELGENDILISGAVALFHDVGRFPQYRQHKTFRDSISVNHAALSARVLIENNVLADLPEQEQETVVRAVTLHNVFSVPAGVHDPALLHLRIIRDADKLDIWRVFKESFDLPAPERPSAAGLGLPETANYSPGVLTELRERRMVKLDQLRSLNDFKLLQLAWIYDLNFIPSLRLVLDRDIINGLGRTLPQTGEIRDVLAGLRKYVQDKITCS